VPQAFLSDHGFGPEHQTANKEEEIRKTRKYSLTSNIVHTP